MAALYAGLLLLRCSVLVPALHAQKSGKGTDNHIPQLYAHAFVGGGASYFTSNDIQGYLGLGDAGVGIGLPTWSYGVRGGFRDAVQVELNFGRAHHNFNRYDVLENRTSVIREMSYATREVQLKVNPLSLGGSGDREPRPGQIIYLIGGMGNVDWGGFQGSSYVMGVELANLTRTGSSGVSLKRYMVSFDQSVGSRQASGSDWILEVKVGLGIGVG